MKGWHYFWRRCVPLIALGVMLAAGAAGKSSEPPKAKLRITGVGFWDDRDMRLSLERLLGAQLGETIEANGVEDAAFLLVSALQAKGFLKPTLEIEFTPVSGQAQRFTFDTTLTKPVPRPLEAKAVTFRVTRGVRYVIEDVQIDGLTAVPLKTARSYFRPDQALFVAGEAKAYTPSRVSSAIDSLLGQLKEQGYAEAKVSEPDVRIDDQTGKVAVKITVTEGPRWDVTALHVEGVAADDIPAQLGKNFQHHAWSTLWQQDVRAQLRQAFFARGYPDVRVQVTVKPGEENAGVKPVEVTALVTSGPSVTVGHVRFEGNVRTKESVLRSVVEPTTGAPLDPLKVERARYALSRLGVFTSVDLHYEPADGEVRDPVFQLTEGKRTWDASLLGGYGSYEQLRGGVELRQMNLWGRAHQARLELVESMKSTRGEYDYTVPELFGETVDGSVKLFGLQRQEVSFLRQEYGATAALKRSLPFNIDATVGYTFQSLRDRNDLLGTSAVDQGQIDVASVDFGLTSDRRDSPLRPRHGYRWFSQLELASRYLGGQPDYQRLELGAAFHTNWGSSRWIHLAVTHGVITTQGDPNDLLLPVNKRFYPGGEASIRGFREGEASPRDATGAFLGAKTYLLLNAELEQALTSSWSAILFTDALGSAARLADYPFDEKLYTAGLGVRYHTLIGPVRLEYGRNLNPRPRDPGGTLHFSVGLPF